MISILKYGETPNQKIFSRVSPSFDVQQIVSDIIENVKENGDKAIIEYAKKFDKAELITIEVTKEEIIEELIKINFPIEYLDKAIEYLNRI